MSRHLRLGAAIAIALVMLAAACSSSGKSNGSTTTTSAGGASGTPGTGVPVTNRNGTPLTAPGGAPITLPPGAVPVTTPNGSVVTLPGGTPVTRAGTTPPAVGTTTPPPVPMRWKLGLDFRTHPDQNPFPNSSGGAPVWTLMQSQSLQRGNYTKLTAYAPSYAAGLAAWHGANTTCGGLPAVGVAIIGPAQVCNTATVQPLAVFLIPDASHLAVVAWKSPVTRNIAIQTGIADLDASCGDGVGYTISRGTTTLTQGALPNGGSKQLPITRTHVNAGETIYFTVGPGASGNADCDTTQLAVTIDTVS